MQDAEAHRDAAKGPVLAWARAAAAVWRRDRDAEERPDGPWAVRLKDAAVVRARRAGMRRDAVRRVSRRDAGWRTDRNPGRTEGGGAAGRGAPGVGESCVAPGAAAVGMARAVRREPGQAGERRAQESGGEAEAWVAQGRRPGHSGSGAARWAAEDAGPRRAGGWANRG